jgi:hypothetical protein
MNNIPEHLMAQAETRKFGSREVKVIPVSGKTTRELMDLFSCPKPTAWKTRKRGYYIIDFGTKTMAPGWFDPDKAYKMAKVVFNFAFRSKIPAWADMEDMIQDGVTRLIELANSPLIENPVYARRVVKTEMVNYLRRGRRQEHEDESRIDTHNWVDYDAGPEAIQHCKPSVDTWHLKQAATERIVRMVAARAVKRA